MDANSIIKKLTNKDVISNANYKASDYRSWYTGKVDGFHNYRLYQGSNYLDITKKTLNMAKTVCEDWADLLGNEKTEIVLPDNNAEILKEILVNNKFDTTLNNAIEKTFAIGNGCLVLGLKNILVGEETKTIVSTKDTKITIDYADYFSMRILNIENKKITECAFVSENSEYTEISMHVKDEKGNYKIINVKVKDDKIINHWEINTNSSTAWFIPLRPNVNNNSFMVSEAFGISIYANAIDVLKGLDDLFDGFCTEYVLARIKTYVSSKAYKVVKDGETGKMVRTFDPYDSLYYELPETADGKPIIQTETPTIRYDAYIAGINTLLNLLSKKCGFGNERYKFDKGSVATATQIISENSDLARSLRKQERMLAEALKVMVMAIKEINNTYINGSQFTDFKISDIIINFDDSVIEDKNAIQERDRADVQAGLMSEVEYRMKHYGKSEEEAKQDVFNLFLYKEIDKYINALQQGAITPKEFVLRCYGKEDTEIINYITEKLEETKNNNPLDFFDETKKDKTTDDETVEDETQDEVVE